MEGVKSLRRDGRMRKGSILHLVTLLLVFLLFSTPINVVSAVACRTWPNREDAQARTSVVESITELFQDISELPNEAFEDPANAKDQRNVLRYNADAVTYYVMIGAYGRAIDKLENDIKKRIEEWILDPWKTDLIKKVQEIIELIRKLCGDWEPPTIVGVLRHPETPEYYEHVTIIANVVDECSGVKSVILNYSVDTTDWVDVTMNLIGGLYVAEIPPLPYDTTVNYKIHAYDCVDNLAISETYSYIVADSHPPTISDIERIPVLPNYNESVTVYATVTEPPNASGVKLVIVSYWNVSAWVNVTMTEGSVYTAVIPALPYATTVQYRVSASDYAGNWATSDVYSYNVTDIFLPLARIDVPVQGSYVSGEVGISVLAYDDNFDRAELIIDGTRVWLSSSAGSHLFDWNTAPYADGTHTIRLIVYDKAGNIGQEAVTVTVDNTSPLAIINAPKDGSYLKGTVLVDVTGTDANFEKMELYIGGILEQTWTAGGSRIYVWDTAGYFDVSYTITLIVYDKAGSIREATITVFVDNILPSVIINAPAEGSYMRDITPIDVTGNDANFDRMELYVDDVSVQNWAESGNQIYSWNTWDYSDGSHKIKLVVYDKAGNKKQTVVTVTVDNTAPTASIIAPLDGSFLKGVVSVEVNGTDTNFARMELYIGGGLLANFSVGGVQTYAWNTPDNETAYSLTLKVYDKAGNLETDEITVNVDNVIPTAEIRKPAGEAYLRGTYGVTIYGHDKNFDRMELRINVDLVKTWTVGGAEIYAWDTPTFVDGSYTIKLVVYDKAGNAVDKTVTVTVDNTPPLIGTPSWVPREPLADEGVEVSATVTETVSGLKNVTLWYKTDEKWQSVTMTLGDGGWTAAIPGQASGVVTKFYTEAYDNAGNGAKTETYEYTVKTSGGWPVAIIGAIGLVIALLTATLLYGLYRRRKKSRFQP